jgi:hypothetical protein
MRAGRKQRSSGAKPLPEAPNNVVFGNAAFCDVGHFAIAAGSVGLWLSKWLGSPRGTAIPPDPPVGLAATTKG